ncbi:MAG: hypothetical protein JXR84_11375 [Anaerolineae bacterium]|nr:hypothetical protein [Anaerolineae bacterium]
MEHERASSVDQTICHVLELKYIQNAAICDRCQQLALRFSTAERTAIDIHLESPVLLHMIVGVHYCSDCDHYFRAQPPFMQPDAVYTNRVMDKAVQPVFEDGLTMRRVPERLARDFWVQLSEGSVRRWCRTYGENIDFETDYQAWVVQEFSGILCVDEVYQGQLALLLAADPAAPEGDRLVGYQLVHGAVTAADVERFLRHLKVAGIEPDEIISDGAAL